LTQVNAAAPISAASFTIDGTGERHAKGRDRHMRLWDIVETSRRVRETSGRLDKVRYLAACLRGAEPDAIRAGDSVTKCTSRLSLSSLRTLQGSEPSPRAQRVHPEPVQAP
jgi:hypothetical protein